MRDRLPARVSRLVVPAILLPPMLSATVGGLSAQTARDVAGEQSAIMERFEAPLTAQPKVKLTVTNDGENAPATETVRGRSDDEKAR